MLLSKDVSRTAQNKRCSKRKQRGIEAAIPTPLIIRYPCSAPGNALNIPCPQEGMLSKNVAIREQAQKWKQTHQPHRRHSHDLQQNLCRKIIVSSVKWMTDHCPNRKLWQCTQASDINYPRPDRDTTSCAERIMCFMSSGMMSETKPGPLH